MMGGADRRDGVIYCRLPRRRDRDQTPVTAQESACRALAAQLGVPVGPVRVYLDHARPRAERHESRAGWRAMIAALGSGAIGHLVLYRQGWLTEEPCDLAELLRAVHRHQVSVHSVLADGELTDPDSRPAVAADAARRCHARRALGRTARANREAAVAAGRPHAGGRRAYGYSAGQYALVEPEAAVVREIYARFLDGDSIRGIALDLNARGVPTAYGNAWSSDRVARILDAPRYAGLVTRHGEVAKTSDGEWQPGHWQACVSLADWERTQMVRRRRVADQVATRRSARRYLLTGLVRCDGCDRNMVGSMVGTFPTYACTANSLLVPGRCSRHIAAVRLEAYLEQLAIAVLTDLDWAGATAIAAAAPTVGRRQTDPLAGVEVGTGAEVAWHRLPPARRAMLLRALFEVVRVGPKSTPRGVFDYGRLVVVQRSR
jgi:site-specific DNA recombinase